MVHLRRESTAGENPVRRNTQQQIGVRAKFVRHRSLSWELGWSMSCSYQAPAKMLRCQCGYAEHISKKYWAGDASSKGNYSLLFFCLTYTVEHSNTLCLKLLILLYWGTANKEYFHIVTIHRLMMCKMYLDPWNHYYNWENKQTIPGITFLVPLCKLVPLFPPFHVPRQQLTCIWLPRLFGIL